MFFGALSSILRVFQPQDGAIKDFASGNCFPARSGISGEIAPISPPRCTHPALVLIPRPAELKLSMRVDGNKFVTVLSSAQAEAVRRDFWNQELKFGSVTRFPDLSTLPR